MNKIKINITIDEAQLQWIDQEVKTQRFANRSHTIRVAIQHLRKETT